MAPFRNRKGCSVGPESYACGSVACQLRILARSPAPSAGWRGLWRYQGRRSSWSVIERKSIVNPSACVRRSKPRLPTQHFAPMSFRIT